jgi:hypothetical protein
MIGSKTKRWTLPLTALIALHPPGGPTPFAADYAPTDGSTAYSGKDFVMQPREKDREPTGKVGALVAFGPEVYQGQRLANQQLNEDGRLKRIGAGTPFATSAGFDELRRRDYYHAKPKREAGPAAADKVRVCVTLTV